MSLPFFKLSRGKGKVWHATGTVPGAKKPFDIDCGDGSEASARKMASILLEKRVQLIKASHLRWEKFHAEKAKAAAPPPAPEPDDDDDDDDDEPDDVDDQVAAAEEHEPEPQPGAPARDNEKIRAKLLALGDAVEPDDVIPPGEREQEDEDPVDEEAGQLVAEVLAGVLVNWHTRKVAKILKSRKPPKRPGEADDRMLAWEHDGISYNLQKLVGKAVAMGPTGKMLVGMTVVTAQMMLDSEPIDGERAPAPAADEPRGNANGTPTDAAAGETEARPPAQLSLVKRQPPLGKFQ